MAAAETRTGPLSPDVRHLAGFGQLVTGQFVARALTFAAIVYLARVLGVVMFGAVGFAAAVAAYFQLVVDAGLDLIAIREIARRELSVENVVSSVLAVRFCLAAAAAGLLWAAASWLAPSPAVRTVIVAYGLTYVSFTCNLKWVFQALERNDLVSGAIVASQAVYFAGVLAYVKGAADAFKVPVLLFGSELIGAGMLFVCYRRQGFTLRFARVHNLSWSLLKEAFPLAGTRALRTLAINFDLLLLGLVGAPRAVGLYTAVSRITLFLRELGDTYYLPLFPVLTRAAQDGAGGLSAVGWAGLRYAAVLIFPIAVGGCLTAPQLLTLLFGREYASAAPVLCLLLIAMVFVMLMGTYRSTLIVRRQQASVFRIVAAGTVLSVAMNIILIPRYSIVGAATSSLVSEVLLFFLAWKALERSVSLSPWPAAMRPALAAAGMGGVLWAVQAWPVFVRIAIAAVSYAVLIVWTGSVSPREILEAWRRHRLPASQATPERVCARL